MNIFDRVPKIQMKISNFENKNRFTHLKIATDENIALLFLESITKVSIEDAKKYISKNFMDMIDLNEIKDYFSDNKNYKVLNKIYFKPKAKNLKTNSILLINNLKKSSIINIYLICEPDKHSNWKICAIDKESKLRHY